MTIKRYRISKSIRKGIEPAAYITIIAAILGLYANSMGIEVSEEGLTESAVVIASVASAVFGVIRGTINWYKNRHISLDGENYQ